MLHSLWQEGLDPVETLIENVAALAGPNDQFNKMGQEHWFSYCDHLAAAFALGVATGQMVHPEVFKTGGAK